MGKRNRKNPALITLGECSLLWRDSRWHGLRVLVPWEGCTGGAGEGRRRYPFSPCILRRCSMPATAPRLTGCSTTSATTSSMPPTKGTSGEPASPGEGDLMSPKRRPLGVELAHRPRKCSPSPLGKTCQAARGGLASCPTCRVLSLLGDTDSCVACKATAAQITFNPHSSVSPVEGAGKGVSLSRTRKVPLPIVTCFYQLSVFCLHFKDSFSSCRWGHCSFRFGQAKPHLGFLLPQRTKPQGGSQGREAPCELVASTLASCSWKATAGAPQPDG